MKSIFRLSSSAFNLTFHKKMSIFTQVFHPITGKIEWEQHEDYDYHQEVARAGFADMLHDTERNQKYFAALKKTIKNLHAQGREAHVLDIGTGTGILSMMAVQSGADSVTACEAFQPMANCARKIIEANGMAEKIHLIQKRSTEIVVGEGGDMTRKANVLVTEVFDTELIGEGAIGIFNHANKCLLTDDCAVIPSLSRVYAQVVETPFAVSWNKPKLLANLDGDILLTTPPSIEECPGEAGVHDIQLSQLQPHQFNPLTDPIEIFKFDFKNPIENCRSIHSKALALNHGSAQAVFFWWDLDMDQEGEIVLSCAPYWAHPDFPSVSKSATSHRPIQNTIPWRDHWMQAVYYLPKPLQLAKDQDFYLNSNHDEYSFWFDAGLSPEPKKIERHTCTCGFHIAYSRSRIGQINQSLRNKKYLALAEDSIDKNSTVLSLSDGSLVGLAAAKLGAQKVYCLEPHRFSSECMRAYIEHNKLDNVKLIKDLKEIDHLEELTHVIGEPYFSTAVLPWESLYFGTLLNSIQDKLAENVKISPLEARIYAVPVEFLDLHKIRLPLGICEGFDLRIFDDFVHNSAELADAKVEAQPLWEYPCRALGREQNILEVKFKTFKEPQSCSGSIPIEDSGSCNGIALWVDWLLDGSGRPNKTVTTGPSKPIEVGKFIEWDMFVRQGVHLITNPVDVVKQKSTLNWSVEYQPIQGDLKFKFDLE